MSWWNLKRTFLWLRRDTKELLSNLGSNLMDVIRDTFIYGPKRLARFLKRMGELVPLAWKDADYDWSPILYYMKFKITKTRDHIEKHDLHTNVKRDVKNMNKALELLEICLDDMYYWDECEKPVIEKYGKSITWEVSSLFNSKEITDRPFRTTRSQREKENDSNRKAVHKANRAFIDKAHKMQEQTWNKFWDLMAKHCREWWD